MNEFSRKVQFVGFFLMYLSNHLIRGVCVAEVVYECFSLFFPEKKSHSWTFGLLLTDVPMPGLRASLPVVI